MFSFLKYLIFALGLIAAYVLIDYYILNRSGDSQSLSETVNKAENTIVNKAQELSDNVQENYVEPVKEEIQNDME